MLPRNERRSLEKIEDRLNIDDPEFARKLTDSRLTRWSLRKLPPRVVLEAASAGTAGVCVVLGEGAGFFLAGALAAVMITTRKCGIRVEN